MKYKPLHVCTPQWMISVIEDKVCEKCNRQVSRSDICAIGIRTFSTEDNRATFYVEHQCEQCKTRIITSFGAQKMGDVEDLCYLLIKQLHSYRQMTSAKKTEKKNNSDAIQDDEVKKLLNFMNKNEFYDEFLKYIGSKEIKKDDKD